MNTPPKSFTSLEAFHVPGRGTVLCAEIGPHWYLLKSGDPIEIALRTGERLRTSIKAIEVFRGTFDKQIGGILLSDNLPPDGMGSVEIFLIDHK